MICYKHQNVAAVATCAQGCGRTLCSECVAEYEPPTCDICASAIQENNIAEVSKERSSIVKRMIINSIIHRVYMILT